MNAAPSQGLSRLLSISVLVLLAACIATAATPQETVLYSFQGGNDGAFPSSDLVADKQGNLYGTTVYGGTGSCTDIDGFVIGCGTVFKLTKPSKSGQKWQEKILYSFQGDTCCQGGDSGYPLAGLVFDTVGNLYGTTSGITGQFNDNGTVFELSPPAKNGGVWTKTVVHTFQGGYDGDKPRAGLIFDGQGRLYGSTSDGAPLTGGTVFRLTPPAQLGGAWTETILYTFTGGTDGENPAGVILDAKGNIFGTTSGGGSFGIGDQYGNSWSGGGTLFELVPTVLQNKPWSENLPFIFPPCVSSPFGGYVEACGTSSQPEGKLVFDTAGNLYGTTELGGSATICSSHGTAFPGCGTVFQLVPPAVAGGSWTQNIIYIFANSSTMDGAFPVGRLTFDRLGNLYGTTMDGCIPWLCNPGLGSVFELSPPAVQGGSWTETILHQFQGGSDGATPVAGLLVEGNALYSTTQYGGAGNCIHTLSQPTGCGTVFTIQP
jgi:hypothetical protein